MGGVDALTYGGISAASGALSALSVIASMSAAVARLSLMHLYLDTMVAMQRSRLAEFVGGPLDGTVTDDWEPVPGTTEVGVPMARMPVPYPMGDAVAIVYVCIGRTADGLRWRMRYVALEGPDGDPLDVRS